MVTREEEFIVEGDLLTDVGGTLAQPVLATPAMIGRMEWVCMHLAAEQLPADVTTVGFEVCIRHVAGAMEGARCVARALLREVVDDRKYRFEVEVLEGERTIGVGTHERRVVARR